MTPSDIAKFFCGDAFNDKEYELLNESDFAKEVKEKYSKEIQDLVGQMIIPIKTKKAEDKIKKRKQRASKFLALLNLSENSLLMKYSEHGGFGEGCEYYYGSRFDVQEELGSGEYNLFVELSIRGGDAEHVVLSLDLHGSQYLDIGDDKVYYESAKIEYVCVDCDYKYWKDRGVSVRDVLKALHLYVKINIKSGDDYMVLSAIDSELSGVNDDADDDADGNVDNEHWTSEEES